MLQRLRAELQAVTGSRTPTREELKQLPYLGCFSKEVLRIYPPFWGSLRYSRAPLEMDGYTFPARSIFAMIRIATHHHPDYWQKPEAFMPERFQADQMQRGVREAYLPFGLGPRLCLDHRYAAPTPPAPKTGHWLFQGHLGHLVSRPLINPLRPHTSPVAASLTHDAQDRVSHHRVFDSLDRPAILLDTHGRA
jgi:hypothetical protein